MLKTSDRSSRSTLYIATNFKAIIRRYVLVPQVERFIGNWTLHRFVPVTQTSDFI